MKLKLRSDSSLVFKDAMKLVLVESEIKENKHIIIEQNGSRSICQLDEKREASIEVLPPNMEVLLPEDLLERNKDGEG